MARKKSLEPRYRIQLMARHWNRILFKMDKAETFDDMEIIQAISSALELNVPIDTGAPIHKAVEISPVAMIHYGNLLNQFRENPDSVEIPLRAKLYEYVLEQKIVISETQNELLNQAYLAEMGF